MQELSWGHSLVHCRRELYAPKQVLMNATADADAERLLRQASLKHSPIVRHQQKQHLIKVLTCRCLEFPPETDFRCISLDVNLNAESQQQQQQRPD